MPDPIRDDWPRLRVILTELVDLWRDHREASPFLMDELTLWLRRYESGKPARCPRCAERTGPDDLAPGEIREAECCRCCTPVEYGHRPYERAPYAAGYAVGILGVSEEERRLPYFSGSQRGLQWLAGYRAGSHDYRRSQGEPRPYPEPER